MSTELLDQELAIVDYVRWTITCRAMMLRIARGQYEGAHATLRDFCRQPRRELATLQSHVASVLEKRDANAFEEGGYDTLESLVLEDDETLRTITNIGPRAIDEMRSIIEEVRKGNVYESYGIDEDLIDEDLCVRPQEITTAPVKRAKGGQDWTQLEAKVYALVKARGPHTAAQLAKSCGVHSISVGKAVAASGRLEKRGDSKVHVCIA